MLTQIDKYLEKIKSIKIRYPNTLFDIEPSWEKLKEKRCPICGYKLLVPRKNPFIVICKGKSHGDRKPFVIKRKKFEELTRGRSYTRTPN
jgi:DNA-directed RNA polymerase subunit RPC12/RpoP